MFFVAAVDVVAFVVDVVLLVAVVAVAVILLLVVLMLPLFWLLYGCLCRTARTIRFVGGGVLYIS